MTTGPQFAPCLMFVGEQCGRAEEAMKLYTPPFKNSRVVEITRFGAGEARDAEGTVKHATFSLNGREFMAQDSAGPHQFGFTPATSIFVTCESEAEVDAAFEALSSGGRILMPLGAYPFSETFGWLNDRFGVSWQLNLARRAGQAGGS